MNARKIWQNFERVISPLEVVVVEDVELEVLGVLFTPADSRSVFVPELFANTHKYRTAYSIFSLMYWCILFQVVFCYVTVTVFWDILAMFNNWLIWPHVKMKCTKIHPMLKITQTDCCFACIYLATKVACLFIHRNTGTEVKSVSHWTNNCNLCQYVQNIFMFVCSSKV